MIVGLAGCVKTISEKEQDDGKEEEASQTGAIPEDPYAKKFEISWVSWACGDIEQDNWAAKKLEEKLNIKLVTKKVDLAQSQQVDLMLASGEMPDCGWIGRSPEKMDEQGLIRTIPKDLITRYAPNYVRLLDSDPIGWKLNLAEGKEDEYLCLSGYRAGDKDVLSFTSVYRLDWLENVGISPNGSLEQIDNDGRIFIVQNPFTQEQFVSIMEAFTKNDPDKNGKDDTYGMTAAGRDAFYWNPIFGMFGFQDTGIVEENGNAAEFYVTNRYKEFLKFANNLYKEGFLDTEFATLNRQKAWEKIASNKAGYSGITVGWLNSGFKTRPPLNMLQNEGAKILITPPETGLNGKGGTRPYSFMNYAYYFYVAKEVDDEKLVRILQLFDYANFDKDAKFFLRYGEEGVHFEWSGKPYESAPILKEGIKTGSNTGLGSYNSNYITDLDIKKLSWEETTAKAQKYAWNEWQKHLLKPYKMGKLH
ncbi:MAG: hypothetical protein HPY74_01595 [Firmicutes bacterium]|nr:hypothetical protein [Bacillota bacterium]